MDRTWSFMTLVVSLPLGLARGDAGAPPPPSGQQQATDPTLAALPSGGRTQSAPCSGPDGSTAF